MNGRELIVARVTVEERWTFVARARGIPAVTLPARSALPVADGGLGYPLGRDALVARHRGYLDARRARLAEARDDELDRIRWQAELDVAAADDAITAATGMKARMRALRRFEIADDRLSRLTESDALPPLSPALRAAVELDIVLVCDAALAAFPEGDRAHLRRSLDLVGELRRFELVTRRSAPPAEA